jgi:hypothetical protein
MLDLEVDPRADRTGSVIPTGKGRVFSNMPTSGMTTKKYRK